VFFFDERALIADCSRFRKGQVMSETPANEIKITPPSPPNFDGPASAKPVRRSPIAEDGTITAQSKGIGLKFFIQVGVSVAALAFILSKANLGQVFDEMREADFLWLALAATMALTGITIASWRWGRLMRSLGISVPFTYLFKSYLVGTFFNTFLPTNVGGDVVRAADIAKIKGCGGAKALTIIILDRLTGVVGMFVLAIPAVFFKLGDIGVGGSGETPTWLIAAIPILAVVLFFGGGWCLTHPAVVKKMLSMFEKIPVVNKFAAKFAMMFETTAICHERPGILIGQVFLAVLLQLNVVVHCWLIGMAYGMSLSFFHYLWIVPLWVLLPMFIPALGGHGVRELVAVFLLTKLQGEPMSVAVAWSLTYAILQMMWGLIGAGVFATRATSSKRGKFFAFSAVGLAAIAGAAVLLSLPEKPIKRAEGYKQEFVFCFGDSLTRSIYPQKLEERLIKDAKKEPPFRVFEQGRNGFNSSQLLQTLKTRPWLLRYDPDYVVLQLGTNDVRMDNRSLNPDQFESNVKNLIELIQNPPEALVPKGYTEGRKPKIILCTIPPLDHVEGSGGLLTEKSQSRITTELNPRLHKLAAEKGLYLADWFEIVSNKKSAGEKLYQPDGVHFNVKGNEALANAVQAIVLKVRETREKHQEMPEATETREMEAREE
jgi:hypothetical protein